MDNRIAIIGYSCILPGGENVHESWDTICEGLDYIRDLPENRLDITGYYNPKKGVKDKIYCKRGGFIPDFDFTPREFGLNMKQMEDCDTNQTLTLLKVKEALSDAKIDPFTKNKKNIGCILGIGGGQKASNEFYSRMNYVVMEKILRKMGMEDDDVENAVNKFKESFPEWRLDSFPGFLGNVTAGRCANTFNLDGMNCVVDAACASSLAALKFSIDEILHGNCDTMITGATCTDTSIGMFMSFSKTPVFSTEQSVVAYNHNSNGMLIGEGSAMFVIKRLSKAVEDGDRIHAVIRGCASSSDGKSSGIYTPTIGGQLQCLQRAYEKSGVDQTDVTLVEGHGTGTSKGDEIELTALQQNFERCKTEQIAVGSIKSQIGHLKACAGFASLIKIILSLKHKVLPKSINVDYPPEVLKMQQSPLYINVQQRPWFVAPGKSRIAGISSFGFGGANYHTVVEEYEPDHDTAYRMTKVASTILLHGNVRDICSDALAQNVLVKDFASQHKIRPLPRTGERCGFLVRNQDELNKMLTAVRDTKDLSKVRNVVYEKAAVIQDSSQICAMFSGQGSQYVNMFSDVAMLWPEFRKSINSMNAASSNKLDMLTSSILYPRKPYTNEEALNDKEISDTQNAQLSTVAVSNGLYEIFKTAGLKPGHMLGHSLGEFVALKNAGVLEEGDMCNLICKRGSAMKTKSKPGSMAAVIGAGGDQLDLPNGINLANVNSKTQVVLSGESEAMDRYEAKLTKEGKFRVVHLKTGGAFHTSLMDAASDDLNVELDKTTFHNKAIKLYSNVTGSEYPDDVSKIKECLKKHMTSSVQFVKEIESVYNNGGRLFLEFGPKMTLTKLSSSILKEKGSDWRAVAINPSPNGNSDDQLRYAALQMAVFGADLDNFDPWQIENPFENVVKSKATLRLNATTYVSKKTIMTREKILNDGYKVTTKSCSDLTDENLDKEMDEFKKQYQEEIGQLKSELEETKSSLNDIRSEMSKQTELLANLVGKMNQISSTSASTLHAPSRSSPATPAVPIVHSVSASTASATAATDTSAAVKVVMEVMADKTGYEVDMIENDMELESELGIDSIKRVEILSDVQDKLGIQVKDVHRLSQTQTVGEIIDLMREELGGSAPSVSKAEPVAATSTSASTSFTSPSSTDSSAAVKVVMEVMADKTGYEVDMIENDMELESELGIDSIKRVEILSDVQDKLGIQVKDVHRLSQTQTVGEIIDLMREELGGSAPSETTAHSTPTAPAAHSTPSTPSGDTSAAVKVVMEVMADKTGYEVDMIENDMELESELGIDSIKRVEILSDVQDKLGIQVKDVHRLSQTQTVGEIIDLMREELGGSASSEPTTTPVQITPVATSPSTPAPSADTSAAVKVVMEVMADKTGYEVDMIENDMELESELGIDSIKRVEILSDVQDKLGIQVKDVHRLSQTQTVGEIIDLMREELGGSSDTATTDAVPPTPTTTTTTTTATTSTADTSAAVKVVMEVMADKTGYEVDMIENDMELESELGIDSIKRVEILSDVQDKLGIQVKDVHRLSQTQTVGEIIDLMREELGGSAPVAEATPTPSSTSSADTGAAVKVVMEVMADKTGYEVDMIENDMELESELGIDSIKRVEILSDVQDKLGIQVKDVHRLSQTQTVGEIIDLMREELSEPNSSEKKKVFEPTDEAVESVADVAASTSASTASSAEVPDVEDVQTGNLDVTEVSPIQIAQPLRQTFKALPKHRPILTCTQSSLISGIAIDPEDYSEAAVVRQLGKLKDVPGGFVFEYNQNADSYSQLRWLFMMAKHLKTALNTKEDGCRTFFVTVIRLDGKLGFGDTINTAEQGAICAFTKTLFLEWPSVFCRTIDVGSERNVKAILEKELACSEASVCEIGYSGTQRYTLKRLPMRIPTTGHQAINKDDVFLVSGGGRGITPHCINAIVARSGGTYYLLGRSAVREIPDWAKSDNLSKAAMAHLKEEAKKTGKKVRPADHKRLVNSITGSMEILESLAMIRSNANTKCEYVSCDITNAQSVKDLVSSIGKPVTGIIHASGVLRDKRIENKKEEDFDAVYGTKIHGLNNLLGACTAPLRHLAVFSSITAVHGNIGQTDYALANEALNKRALAYQNAHADCQVHSMCFGPWESGMVTPALKKHFEAQGVQIIAINEGARLVEGIMNRCTQTQSVIGNWGMMPQTMEQDTHELFTSFYKDDKVLQGHRIQGTPVVPFTYLYSLGLESVLHLNPGHAVKSVTDIYLFKGVRLTEDIKIKIVCKRTEDATFSVKLFQNTKGKWIPAFKQVVELQARSSKMEPIDLDVSESNVIEKDRIYDGTTLFHTGDFQVIKKVLSHSSEHMTSQLVPPSTPLSIPSGHTNGTLYDACNQILLVWCRQYKNLPALPMNGTVLYASLNTTCTKIYVHMNDIQENDKEVSATLTVVNEHRVPIYKVISKLICNPDLKW